MMRDELSSMNAEAISFEATVDAAVRSGPMWRRHPRLGDGRSIWLRATMAMAGRRVRSLCRRVFGAALAGQPSADIIQLEELRAVLSSQLAAARAILGRVRPRAIVCCEDGIASLLPMHTAARAAGIPVTIVPYGNAVQRDLEIALDAKKDRGELLLAGGAWSNTLASHASQWIKQGEHAGALMFPEAYIVAAESLGMTLRDAWTVHGGYAERLCVESEQMRRLYVSEGLPESKLVVTGTPYCDVLLRAVDQHPDAKAALRQP